jgi:hypothetical protein
MADDREHNNVNVNRSDFPVCVIERRYTRSGRAEQDGAQTSECQPSCNLLSAFLVKKIAAV